MIGDEDAIFDDPPADDAAFNEDAGGDTALAEDPLAVSDHVSMPEADSPDRADAQAEAEAFARQFEQMQEVLGAAQEQIERLQQAAAAQGKIIQRLLEHDDEAVNDLRGWLEIQQRAIEQLQNRPDAPVAPDPLDYPHPTVFVASEGSTAKQWAERAMKNGATTSYADGRTCTNDSDTSAAIELGTNEFVLLEMLDPNGGSRCTRYLKVGGGGATWMKVKTASGSDLVAIANTWDGTTAGSTDIPVLMAVPAKVGLTFHAIRTNKTGKTSGGNPVVWIEHVTGETEDTGSVLNLGDSVEGSESADTISGSTAADNKPVNIYMGIRAVYNDAGDEVLYFMARKLKINSRGLVYAEGAEVRYTVDAPEDCP